MADLTILGSAGPLRAVQSLQPAPRAGAAGTAAPAAATEAAQSAARANTTATFAGGLSQSTLLAAQSSAAGGGAAASASGLTEEQQAVVAEMKATDAKVRAHEQAHLAAGGQYASGPTYQYERGPDGGLYAVAGEVHIDTSPVAGDPEATIAKAEQVRAAAQAPADPSAQDRKVAAAAAQAAAQARVELSKQGEGQDGSGNENSGTPSSSEATGSSSRNRLNQVEPRPADPSAQNAAKTYDAVTALVAAVQQQTVNLAA